MTRKAHGVIRQNTVVLDEAFPEMEGRRVEVEMQELAPDALPHDEAELNELWNAWAAGDKQGPILDEPETWP